RGDGRGGARFRQLGAAGEIGRGGGVFGAWLRDGKPGAGNRQSAAALRELAGKPAENRVARQQADFHLCADDRGWYPRSISDSLSDDVRLAGGFQPDVHAGSAGYVRAGIGGRTATNPRGDMGTRTVEGDNATHAAVAGMDR